MTHRRAIIAALILVVLCAAIFALRTVTADLPPIPSREKAAILVLRNPPALDAVAEQFVARMEEMGYTGERAIFTHIDVGADLESTKVRIEDAIAKEEPDLIYAIGVLAARAAKQVIEERDEEIPVLFGVVSNPVGVGIVADIKSPGGFITGITPASNLTAPKRVEFLKEILPNTKRIIYAWSDPNTSGVANVRAAAQKLGIELVEAQTATVSDMTAYIDTFAYKSGDAILRTSDAIGAGALPGMIRAALENKVPLIGTNTGDTERGALMSYGADYAEVGRASARLADLILKGTHPSRIPIEEASRFQMSVNLKTASHIGVSIPQPFLLKTNVIVQAE
jgi:putative tryptophan/tyrosine transport system substrate-binding protein